MAEAFRPWLVGQVEACAQRSLNDNTKKSREYHWHVRVLLQGILAEYDRRAESAERQIQTLTAERDGLKEALRVLRIDANRLCDRNLGGTYEADCRRAIAAADAVLYPAKEADRA